MAQRPRHPADGLEGEAVAHRAVALHLDRLDAHAIGFDPVAIRAFELLAEIITAAETRCPARDAPGRPQMPVVREFEDVVIDPALGQRHSPQLPAGGGAAGRAETGM